MMAAVIAVFRGLHLRQQLAEAAVLGFGGDAGVAFCMGLGLGGQAGVALRLGLGFGYQAGVALRLGLGFGYQAGVALRLGLGFTDQTDQTSEIDENEPGYAAAMSELEEILGELEGDDPDIDVLAAQVARAATLIEVCRRRITNASIQVERVVTALESGATP